MGERFVDVPMFTYTPSSEILVVCPKCGSEGTVSFNRFSGIAKFDCSSCYDHMEVQPGLDERFKVVGQCTSTGRFFNEYLPGEKIHGQKLRMKCPYCDEEVVCDVEDRSRGNYIWYADVQDGFDPFFHLPLLLQVEFRGNIVWAVDREHLQYLIDYLSADLRISHPQGAANAARYGRLQTQSSTIPRFMKTAKNRDALVRKLRKLQEKNK